MKKEEFYKKLEEKTLNFYLLNEKVDEQGRVIYYKMSYGDFVEFKCERWVEYYGDKTLIKFDNRNMEMELRDKNFNVIYYKSHDFKKWYKYDENNRVIHEKNNSNGWEYWYGYYEDGREFYLRDNGGREEYYIYNGDEKITMSKKEYEQWEFLSREKINPFELLDLEI